MREGVVLMGRTGLVANFSSDADADRLRYFVVVLVLEHAASAAAPKSMAVRMTAANCMNGLDYRKARGLGTEKAVISIASRAPGG